MILLGFTETTSLKCHWAYNFGWSNGVLRCLGKAFGLNIFQCLNPQTDSATYLEKHVQDS